jgi:hypothetical protein
MSDNLRPNKLNLDSLFEHKKHVDMQTVSTYNIILNRIHKRIQMCSRQRIDNESCWFVVPEIMIGVPRYDVRLCIAYLVQQLKGNGLNVRYTHPNLIFICWKHWIPDYVRSEIKRQTGVQVDGFGNEVSKTDVASAMASKTMDPRFMPVSKYKPTGRFS